MSPITLDDVWKALHESVREHQKTDQLLKEFIVSSTQRSQDIDRQFQELAASSKETDRKFQETDRRFQETDRIIRRLERQLGNLGNRLG